MGLLLISTVVMMLVMGLAIFLPAGTLQYWQAWAFLGVFLALTLAVTAYFMAVEPSLLERRLRVREPGPRQRWFQHILRVCFVGGMVLAGFDHRYGWSHVPVALALTGDTLIIAGFVWIARVFRENRFAGSTVEVEPEQQVISTGPYALVRHPMYLGAVPFILGIGLALGSYWADIPYLIIVIGVIVRIIDEEALLLRDLPGYEEYRRKVRWRLLPGVW